MNKILLSPPMLTILKCQARFGLKILALIFYLSCIVMVLES